MCASLENCPPRGSTVRLYRKTHRGSWLLCCCADTEATHLLEELPLPYSSDSMVCPFHNGPEQSLVFAVRLAQFLQEVRDGN